VGAWENFAAGKLILAGLCVRGMNEQAFRRLISGEQRGWVAGGLRALLWLGSLGYGAAVACRNWLFDAGVLKAGTAAAPVVSIGNVTTGGTGKTPVAAMLCQHLQRLGSRPGLISRGYRAVGDEGNDEKRVLELLVPGVPHVQNANRRAAAAALTGMAAECRPDVIVMDDGFQHRRLHRDLNLVLIDATCPFGFGYLLPRGLLREPIGALRRADAVMLTRCGLIADECLREIEETVLLAAPGLKGRIMRVDFRPRGFVGMDGRRVSFDALMGQAVFLMSGIGNPGAFEATCRVAGLEVVGKRWFADHHHFSREEVTAVQSEAVQAGADAVVSTVKDLVKLGQGSESVLAVDIEAVLMRETDQGILEELLLGMLGERVRSMVRAGG
jgi:tetraacyldisaccharide 4'-kinase